MKPLLHAAILCSLCLLAILPTHTRAQDSSPSSDAPYLYYFSSDIDAVVIERADGTDTRVLGAGLFEEIKPYKISTEHGWSPSGKWLAWTSVFVPAYGAGPQQVVPFIVSVDGKRNFPFTDEFYSFEMAWSPTEDILLMWGNTLEKTEEGYDTQSEQRFLTAYDFSSNKYLFTFNDLPPLKQALSSNFVPSWSPDGQHIFINHWFSNDTTTLFVVLSKDGQVVTTLGPVEAVKMDTNSYEPMIRSGTKVVYFDDSLIIADLVTDEQIKVEGIGSKPELFLFSPDQQKALIVQNGLWLWSSEDGLIQLLDRLQFVDLGYTFTNVAYWSPNSQYALIYGDISESQSTLWFIDVSQQQVQDVLHVDEKTLYWFYPNWYWTADNQALVSGLVDATRQADNYYGGYAYSALIDFPTLDVQEFDFVSSSHPNSVAFNIGNSIFATVIEGPVIYRRDTNETLLLRPDYDSYMSARGGVAHIDESGQWLLTMEEALVSSGGSKIGHAGVSKLDGTTRRDLTGLFRFADWLPSQVNVDDLPPPLKSPIPPRPIWTIQTDNWISQLAWSPDGERLAIVHNLFWHGTGAVSIWNFSKEALTPFNTKYDDPENIGEAFVVAQWQETADTFELLIIVSPDPIESLQNYRILALAEQYSLALIEESYLQQYIYDLEADEIVTEIECSSQLFVIFGYSDSFSPDGTLLACHTGIFDVTTGEKLADIPVTGSAFAFSPDGTQLAVAASWDVLIYDVAELLEWKSAKYNFARHNQ
ncbi:MAG: hypothetical protein L0154_16635 [Chloroflexi bacterium]|nr:hypothetical protein [Chloroflexota bacterium]